MVTISKVLKGSPNEKATILHHLSTKNTETSLGHLLEVCKTMIDAYVKVVEMSGLGIPYMQARTTNEANKSLAEYLTNSLPEGKHDNLCVDDVETWIRREVLVTRLLEDVFKACFLGATTILETRKHGLKEGCEPTVEYSPKRYL